MDIDCNTVFKTKYIFIRLESEILAQLTKTQVELQNWRFLSALMSLYGAQTRMSAWERTLQSKEVSMYNIFYYILYLQPQD